MREATNCTRVSSASAISTAQGMLDLQAWQKQDEDAIRQVQTKGCLKTYEFVVANGELLKHAKKSDSVYHAYLGGYQEKISTDR